MEELYVSHSPQNIQKTQTYLYGQVKHAITSLQFKDYTRKVMYHLITLKEYVV